ncbi:MAG: flavin-dependent oxidoreductase [Cellvibrionaceae bacterium]
MQQPVLIAGAGPVGLTLALLLNRQSIPVKVYESVSEIKPLGVGINLLPHSVRVLFDLGLNEALDEVAVRTGALHYYNRHGQPIWAEPRGIEAGYQFPQYSINRGDLQMTLFRAVQEAIGEENVITGHKLIDWENTDDGIRATFLSKNASGGESRVVEEGACLVAADGIHSTARKKLYPNEGDPIYGGRILWRGVTLAEPFLDGRTMFMAGHQDCKFVAYPITKVLSKDSTQIENFSRSSGDKEGKAIINWIAELSVPDWKKSEQDWNKEVSIDIFADHFKEWDFGWVDVPKIISGSEHVYEFPLSDRNPLSKWTHGNMTLIGDAAHPMYPIGSNGASQGILDAEALSIQIEKYSVSPKAIEAYEEERRPATSKIVLLNRQNGPEQVMQMAEERSPEGFKNIQDIISHEELENIAAKYKQTAGFSVDAVNSAANNNDAHKKSDNNTTKVVS